MTTNVLLRLSELTLFIVLEQIFHRGKWVKVNRPYINYHMSKSALASNEEGGHKMPSFERYMFEQRMTNNSLHDLSMFYNIHKHLYYSGSQYGLDNKYGFAYKE